MTVSPKRRQEWAREIPERAHDKAVKQMEDIMKHGIGSTAPEQGRRMLKGLEEATLTEQDRMMVLNPDYKALLKAGFLPLPASPFWRWTLGCDQNPIQACIVIDAKVFDHYQREFIRLLDVEANRVASSGAGIPPPAATPAAPETPTPTGVYG